MSPETSVKPLSLPLRCLLILAFATLAPQARGQAVDRAYPATRVRVVRLESDEGFIRCEGADMDEVHVSVRGSRNGLELHPGDAQFAKEVHDDTLVLRVTLRRPSSPFAVNQDALLDLSVPLEVIPDARVEDGDIECRHLGAGARLETRDGGIHVEDCEGPLDLHSRDGEITVLGHDGGLAAEFRDGSLKASGLFPWVDVQSSDGGVDLRLGTGSLARPAGATAAVPECRVRTGGGSINLKLPNEIAGILTASTRGRLDAGSYEPSETSHRKPGEPLRVLLGLGPVRVEVRSDSGSIRLR